MNFQIIDECTRVLASRDALWRCGSIEPRRNEAQRADLMLRFADRSWLRSSEGAELIEAFRSHPSTSTVERQRSAFATSSPMSKRSMTALPCGRP
jgi:hypothetical protein